MELSNADKCFLELYLASLQVVSDSSLEMNYDVTDLRFNLIGQSKLNSYGNRVTRDVLATFRQEAKLDFYRKKAIEQQRVIKILAVNRLPDVGTMMIAINWRPIYNPQTRNMVALLCFSHNLEVFNIVDILRRFYQTDNFVSPRPIDLSLTEREKQVVFFFVLNLDSQEIAAILTKIENKTISKNSINHMFSQQLFPKFGVFNRKSLYNKLIHCGYSRLMPINVLDEKIVFEITDYIEFD
ncbi:MAG: hypothetical protein K2Y14_13045 [Burkholderiales bacterium]|nr:hypothetical protein [Burkholderiales bacterium]